MADLTGAIRDTVSISRFNRGYAGQIFDEVKLSGAKVVIKNNEPECVLLSPDEYVRLMDEVNGARTDDEVYETAERCSWEHDL